MATSEAEATAFATMEIRIVLPPGLDDRGRVDPEAVKRLALQAYVFLASGGEEREAARRLQGYEPRYSGEGA
jgi:hypothetical protein